MAIINSYPKGTPKAEDLLIGTDVPQEYSGKEGITKNFKITDIANLVISETSAVTGSGTLNYIPAWTPDGNTLGNSMLFQYPTSPGNFMTQVGRVADVGQPDAIETLIYPGYFQCQSISTNQIFAGDPSTGSSGFVRFVGDARFGDNINLPDTLTILSRVEDKDFNLGTAGQVLVANASSQLKWTDSEDVVSGSIAKLIPFQVTASAGGSSAYNADNNIVEFSWTGGNGTYTLFLPTATGDNQYRNIRFVTNSTFPGGASDKVQIAALPGETIDGAAFFEISKQYEGVSVWSNGTEWIIIQAKAH